MSSDFNKEQQDLSPIQADIKLQIAFPKSDQDHRLQLVAVNGSIFAIVFAPLESLGPIALHCEEWSLVLLAPIKSKKNVVVSAINIICLNEISSEEGNVNIHASHRLVKFAHLMKPAENVSLKGECGQLQFEDDPGAFLHYYRLYEGIVSHVRDHSSDALLEAQKKFILSLCTIAAKMEEQSENLNIHKVLSLWNIESRQTDLHPF